MRLNLLNRTVIVTGAVMQAGLTQMNPRFGEVQVVNKDLFKFSEASDPSSNVLIQKVDLGEMFKNIPQSLCGLQFEESLVGDTQALYEALGIDPLQDTPAVDTASYEQAPEGDELGQLFVNWLRLVGIADLTRGHVDLSVLDDCLYIDVRRSVVYTGNVQVKIK